jgi:cytidylate kinase
MIITIDGPSASGKSTIAQLIAKKKGIFYLNTGLLYRALAYLVFYPHATLLDGVGTPPPSSPEAMPGLETGPAKLMRSLDQGERNGVNAILTCGESVVPPSKIHKQSEGSTACSTPPARAELVEAYARGNRSTCAGKESEIQFSNITREFLDSLPSLEYNYANGQATVAVHGQDITGQCYATPNIDKNASKLSALPVVREFLLDILRAIALQHDVVADGRDCGTVIFPQAEHKFYLTASLDVRAQRRLADPKIQALGLTFEHIRADLAERDERDKNRAVAPLVVPADAVFIDSSCFSVDQVANQMLFVVEEYEKKAL